jgi:ribonucrease Y
MSFALGATGAVIASLLLFYWRLPALRKEALDAHGADRERQAQVTAKEQLFRQREAFEASLQKTRRELEEIEGRCRVREDALDRRLEEHENRERELARRERALAASQAELEAQEAEVSRIQQRELRELEKASGMRREEAEHRLLDRIEKSFQSEAEEVVARAEEALQHDIAGRARDVLLTAMERYGAKSAGEALISVVPLDDELKAVLIGREGRNARAFEAEAGVDLLIDDTPGAVVISAFEPVRREIARRALVRLLDDGRIQPARIKEVVAETRQEMDDVVVSLGDQAAEEVGVSGVHPRLLALLGRLEFLTSVGQNVRRHAIESAQLSGLLAAELGLDADLARRCALLHSVGKAVDHTGDGGHAKVGADFARRCDEDAVVVNAIQYAGEPSPGADGPASPYAVLTAIAGSLSAGRPGAADESVETAIRRRESVEAIAESHAGVQRCYAVQGGRELRVIVDPVKVSDKGASKLAREVAKAITESVTGPGEVRVTVIREVRCEEIAE